MTDTPTAAAPTEARKLLGMLAYYVVANPKTPGQKGDPLAASIEAEARELVPCFCGWGEDKGHSDYCRQLSTDIAQRIAAFGARVRRDEREACRARIVELTSGEGCDSDMQLLGENLAGALEKIA